MKVGDMPNFPGTVIMYDFCSFYWHHFSGANLKNISGFRRILIFFQRWIPQIPVETLEPMAVENLDPLRILPKRMEEIADKFLLILDEAEGNLEFLYMAWRIFKKIGDNFCLFTPPKTNMDTKNMVWKR